MVHWWDELTFLHWRFEPDAVQRLLPAGLTVETHGRQRMGRARAVLPPRRAARRAVGAVAVALRRDERAHLRPQRRRRARHLVLLARRRPPRRGASRRGRPTGIPYFWSQMSIERAGSTDRRYQCRRRWPGPARRAQRRRDRDRRALPHRRAAPSSTTSSPRAGRCSARRGRACTTPAPSTTRGRCTGSTPSSVHDELIPAAGLPAPERRAARPLLAVVEVRIGWPSRVDID